MNPAHSFSCPPRLFVVAGGLSFGIVLAWWLPLAPAAWSLLTIACALLAIAPRRHQVRMVAALFAVVALGGARMALDSTTHRRDIACRLPNTGIRSHVVLTILDASVMHERVSFGTRDARRRTRARIEYVEQPGNTAIALEGDVVVHLPAHGPRLAPGDRIRVLATIRPPRPPTNPGQTDRRTYMRRIDVSADVDIVDVRLIERLGRADDVGSVVRRRIAQLRDLARRRLLAGVDGPHARLVIGAITLGYRNAEGYRNLADTFRRVGLAHVLAVSGMHLGLLLAMVMIALEPIMSRRARGFALIAITLVFITLVPARAPLMRAAMMAATVGAGMILGRRWRLDGLVALSAVIALMLEPLELFAPGFQLSYGIVLALILIAPRVTNRLLAAQWRERGAPGTVIVERMIKVVASTMVAWAISLPLSMHHFGYATPLAIPASIAAAPLVGVLLAGGFARILLGDTIATLDQTLALLLDATGSTLAALATTFNGLPLSIVHVASPSAAWTIACLAVITERLVRGPARRGSIRRRARFAAVMLLLGWIAWPGQKIHDGLRIDVLDVGDGSCWILRSGSSTVIFDAGSTGRPHVGRRIIIPALRALGARRVDALIISHANADHYAGATDLLDAVPIEEIIVTPAFLATARDSEAVRAVIDTAQQRGTAIRYADAGSRRSWGDAHFTWLHPGSGDVFDDSNDTSMAIDVRVDRRHILLTGDLEVDGLNRLMDRHPNLTCDVLELPHHGSFNNAAVRFVEHVDPGVVIQSTGPRRLSPDEWTPHLDGRRRYVTCRDGAISAIIDGDIKITTAIEAKAE